MKKIITVLIFVFATSFAVSGQNAIAKFKYEEAEEAYAENKFEVVLSKLNEVETMLKATNPKIMYLKIFAQSKIIEANLDNNFELLANTKILSGEYLKKYESLPNNEEKYRDIYKISEKLKSYPSSLDELTARKKDEEKKKYDDNFMNYNYFKNFYEFGISIAEAEKKFPQFFNNCKIFDDSKYIEDCDKVYYQVNGNMIKSKGDKIISCQGTLFDEDDHGFIREDIFFIRGDKFISEWVELLTNTFGFSPSKKEDAPASDSSPRTFTYTWEKNEKKIQLFYQQYGTRTNSKRTRIILAQKR